MTKHEPQTAGAHQTGNQAANATRAMPIASSYMMPVVPPAAAAHAQVHRSPSSSNHKSHTSHSKGSEFSSQFKSKEAAKLNKIAGRTASGSKLAQSQMMMMMQQNNMMMMQMMSQQQQRYSGSHMGSHMGSHVGWGPQQVVPNSGAENAVVPQVPSPNGLPPHMQAQRHLPGSAGPSSAPGSGPSSMTRAGAEAGGHGAQPPDPNSSTSTKPANADQRKNKKHDGAASPERLDAVDRKAALQVLQAVEAKFQELCQYQSKLMAKINTMQERIAEKDAMIDKLRKQEASSSKADTAPEDGPLAADLEEERDALTNELSRLRVQMMDTQNTMEDAMETTKVLAVQFEEGAAGAGAEAPVHPSDGPAMHVPADNLGGADSISAAGSNLDSYVTAGSSAPGAEFDTVSTSGSTLGNGSGGAQVSVSGRPNSGIGRGRLPPEPEKQKPQEKTLQEDGKVQADEQQQTKDDLQAGESPKLQPEPQTLQGPPAEPASDYSFMQPVELLSGALPTENGERAAEGEKTAKKTMMSWKHLATPKRNHLKPATTAKDEESSDQSGSTPPDSDSTHRSQASPVAGSRRHVFHSQHDDHARSASLRLPAVRSDIARKRSQLEKMFER